MESEVCVHNSLMTGCDCLLVREATRMILRLLHDQAIVKKKTHLHLALNVLDHLHFSTYLRTAHSIIYISPLITH